MARKSFKMAKKFQINIQGYKGWRYNGYILKQGRRHRQRLRVRAF